jgi:hypothetical protein
MGEAIFKRSILFNKKTAHTTREAVGKAMPIEPKNALRSPKAIHLLSHACMQWHQQRLSVHYSPHRPVTICLITSGL